MPVLSDPKTVLLFNVYSKRFLGVSHLDLTQNEETSTIGISEDDARNKGEQVTWLLQGIQPTGQEITLRNKKTGAFLTYQTEPLAGTSPIKSHNAIVRQGGEAPYFYQDPGDGGVLLNVGRELFLTLREIGSITGVWCEVDTSKSIASAYHWLIKEI